MHEPYCSQPTQEHIERVSRMLCDADGNDPDQPSWMVYREMAIMTCRMQNASKAFADQHSKANVELNRQRAREGMRKLREHQSNDTA